MVKEAHITAIDLGTHSVRVLQAKFDPGSIEPSVVGAVSAPSAGLRRGVVVDLDEAVTALSGALEKLERMTGIQVNESLVTVGGTHLVSLVSKGVIAVSKADGEVSEADVQRVLDASQAVAIPPNREVLHVLPRAFILDGQEGIKDPLGMTGVRLEVDATIVHGSSPLVRQTQRVLQQAGAQASDMVIVPLAAAEAVLTKKQKELGVAMVDFGGGTTSVAIFEENTLLHTGVVPLGSAHITNDLAIGLRISIEVAERVKLLHGHARPSDSEARQMIDLSKLDEAENTHVERGEIMEIVEARLDEVFTLVRKQLQMAGRDGKLPAGVVLTGGGSNLPGLVEYAKEKLELPVQLGRAQGLQTVIDRVDDPAFSAVCGLVLWSVRQGLIGDGSFVPTNLLKHPGVLKLRSWFKSFLP